MRPTGSTSAAWITPTMVRGLFFVLAGFWARWMLEKAGLVGQPAQEALPPTLHSRREVLGEGGVAASGQSMQGSQRRRGGSQPRDPVDEVEKYLYEQEEGEGSEDSGSNRAPLRCPVCPDPVILPAAAAAEASGLRHAAAAAAAAAVQPWPASPQAAIAARFRALGRAASAQIYNELDGSNPDTSAYVLADDSPSGPSGLRWPHGLILDGEFRASGSSGAVIWNRPHGRLNSVDQLVLSSVRIQRGGNAAAPLTIDTHSFREREVPEPHGPEGVLALLRDSGHQSFNGVTLGTEAPQPLECDWSASASIDPDRNAVYYYYRPIHGGPYHGVVDNLHALWRMVAEMQNLPGGSSRLADGSGGLFAGGNYEPTTPSGAGAPKRRNILIVGPAAADTNPGIPPWEEPVSMFYARSIFDAVISIDGPELQRPLCVTDLRVGSPVPYREIVHTPYAEGTAVDVLRAASTHIAAVNNITTGSGDPTWPPKVMLLVRLGGKHRVFTPADIPFVVGAFKKIGVPVEVVSFDPPAGSSTVEGVTVRHVVGAREQAAAAAGCDIMIGVHGAGLGWSLFMRPGALLVQIAPEGLTAEEASTIWRVALGARVGYFEWQERDIEHIRQWGYGSGLEKPRVGFRNPGYQPRDIRVFVIGTLMAWMNSASAAY